VAQQYLNGAQVRARLEQVGGVRMAQRVRTDTTIDAGGLGGEAHRVPDALGRERLVGEPAVLPPREEVRLRTYLAVVLPQGCQQRGAEGHFARVATLPALNANHHALAVDVGDLQLQQLAAAQARAVERHEQRAVIEVLRAGNESPHFIRTQDRGQPAVALRCGSSSFSSRRLRTRM
jgi:hypothetical protein